jgi:hypothetical protein
MLFYFFLEILTFNLMTICQNDVNATHDVVTFPWILFGFFNLLRLARSRTNFDECKVLLSI